MKFLAEAAHLDACASALASMVPNNALLPILGTIKIEAADDALVLTATNMDCLATITMPAQILEPGNVAIEAERLAAFTGGLKGQIAIETTAQGASIKCNRRNAKLAVLPPDEFPDIPFEGDEVAKFDLPGEAISLIGDMGFATAAKESTRPYLTGVHLFSLGNKLIAEAANGMLAVRYSFDVECSIPAERSIIIPRDALPYIKRLFPEGCSLLLSTNKVQATDAAVRFVSKLVHGPYPSMDSFIPAASEALVIECDAEELAKATAKVAAIAGGDSHWVTLFPRGDHLLLSSTNKADAEDVVAANCTGDIDQLTLSTKTLCPLLEALGASTVRITQGSNGAPVRIDPPAMADRLGIVMPVRFKAVERLAA